MQRRYTFDYLVQLLVDRGDLDPNEANDLTARASAQRYRLESTDSRRQEIGPAQVLASFQLRLDGGVLLTEDRITARVAAREGLPYEKIDPLKLDAALITTTLSRPFARRHCLLPLDREEGGLRVATDDPFNLEAMESVRTLVDGEVTFVLSARSDIHRHIREVYGFRKTLAAAEADLSAGSNLGNLEQLFRLKTLDEIEDTDQHVINAVEYLLHYAFDQRASDIHIEPKREHAVVRLRIDGLLHTIQRIPMLVHRAVVNRIKTLARMDISEKRKPQDGRIKTGGMETEIELRVSTLPVAFGEKVVIRIFDPQILLQDLEGLGLSDEDLARFSGFLARPHGLILVTGPTGSGKTTTLYSALQDLATDRVNVTTIEDPIEMVVEEFNQTAVHSRVGITFASSLRTILRQDPDVIMVGEIRDAETASQAIQAALTGHLVLSTLHTNDSAGAITRLVDLGVEPFLVASTVVGIVAQRLVRTVCESCRTSTALSDAQALALGIETGDGGEPLTVAAGKGCVDCRFTGLSGRSGLFEILEITTRIQDLITAGATRSELLSAARSQGLRSLRESAVQALLGGQTSFEEVLRVTAEAKER